MARSRYGSAAGNGIRLLVRGAYRAAGIRCICVAGARLPRAGRGRVMAVIPFPDRRTRERRRADMAKADLAVEAHAAVSDDRRAMHTAFRLIHGGRREGALVVLAGGIEETFTADERIRRLAGPDGDWGGDAA